MTTHLHVTANLDIDPWSDLEGQPLVNGDKSALLERIGVLPNSTDSGRATVAVVVRLPDGRAVLAETTLRNFLVASGFIAGCPVARMEDL
jgi:hypothetical protein